MSTVDYQAAVDELDQLFRTLRNLLEQPGVRYRARLRYRKALVWRDRSLQDVRAHRYWFEGIESLIPVLELVREATVWAEEDLASAPARKAKARKRSRLAADRSPIVVRVE